MQKWINLVETASYPLREKEFNEWYDNVHLPDVIKTPGFIAATRYMNKEFRDGRGKYLTLYEIETDDIDTTMKVRLDRREMEIKQGRLKIDPNLFTHFWRDVLYKRISHIGV